MGNSTRHTPLRPLLLRHQPRRQKSQRRMILAKIMISQLDMANVLVYHQFPTTIKVKKRSATRRSAGSVATLTSTMMEPSVSQSGVQFQCQPVLTTFVHVTRRDDASGRDSSRTIVNV